MDDFPHRAESTPSEQGCGRLMIRCEPGEPRRVHVIGSLTGGAIEVLLDVVAGEAAVLDLSRVDQVDDPAVRALAGLGQSHCTLRSCPRWLGLWLDRVCRGDERDDPAAREGATASARGRSRRASSEERSSR